MDMDSPRLAVDGRCDARVSCGDETSGVRGTRSECRVLGSSRAVAVTDVGRVRVCGSTAFADRRVAIARVKRTSALYLRLDRQSPELISWRAFVGSLTCFEYTPLTWQTVFEKSLNGHQRPFSVKNPKNMPRFFFFLETRRTFVAGVSRSVLFLFFFAGVFPLVVR